MNTDIDMGGNAIKNLKTPVSAQDAVNKAYTEANYVQLTGPTNDLSMNNHKTTNLGMAIDPLDAISKQYIQNNVAPIFINGTTNSNGVFMANEIFGPQITASVFLLEVHMYPRSNIVNTNDTLISSRGLVILFVRISHFPAKQT